MLLKKKIQFSPIKVSNQICKVWNLIQIENCFKMINFILSNTNINRTLQRDWIIVWKTLTGCKEIDHDKDLKTQNETLKK